MQAEGRRRKQAKKSKQAGTSKQEEASKRKQASKQASKQTSKQARAPQEPHKSFILQKPVLGNHHKIFSKSDRHARTKTFQDVPPAAFDSRKSRTWLGTETARKPTLSRPWHCNLRIFFPKLSTTAAAPQGGWRRARRPRLLFSFN